MRFTRRTPAARETVQLTVQHLDKNTSNLIVRQPGSPPERLHLYAGPPTLRLYDGLLVLPMPRWMRGRHAILDPREYGRFAMMVKALDDGPQHDSVLCDLLDLIHDQGLTPEDLGKKLIALSYRDRLDRDETLATTTVRNLRHVGFVDAADRLEDAERLRHHMSSVADSTQVDILARRMQEALDAASGIGDVQRAQSALAVFTEELEALCRPALQRLHDDLTILETYRKGR